MTVALVMSSEVETSLTVSDFNSTDRGSAWVKSGAELCLLNAETVVAVIATLLCLTACDVDLFGLERKRLGGGYSLVLTEVENACALVPPHQNGAAVVVEVGLAKDL